MEENCCRDNCIPATRLKHGSRSRNRLKKKLDVKKKQQQKQESSIDSPFSDSSGSSLAHSGVLRSSSLLLKLL